jgi:hypothetical protein
MFFTPLDVQLKSVQKILKYFLFIDKVLLLKIALKSIPFYFLDFERASVVAYFLNCRRPIKILETSTVV